MDLCHYPNPLSLEEITGSHRYLPGSTSLPRKKPTYVKHCRCNECGEKRLLSANPRTFLSDSRHGGYVAQRKRRGYGERFYPAADPSEDVDLARDCCPLPGDYRDRFVLKKRPSLSREEAFRDPTTSRSNSRQNSWSGQDGMNNIEIAELYRLGILYDDEHVRGSGFNLDSIPHSEPIYSIRPTKRPRRAAKPENGLHESICGSLPPLNLSFADLGADEAIANYLISNSDFRFDASESDFLPSDFTFGHSRNVSTSTAPVTIIYEVDQPPAEDEVPPLSQGADDSSQEEDGPETQPQPDVQEDEDSGWAFLPTPVHSPSPSLHGDDATPGGANAQETWIVLGDDS